MVFKLLISPIDIFHVFPPRITLSNGVKNITSERYSRSSFAELPGIAAYLKQILSCANAGTSRTGSQDGSIIEDAINIEKIEKFCQLLFLEDVFGGARIAKFSKGILGELPMSEYSQSLQFYQMPKSPPPTYVYPRL